MKESLINYYKKLQKEVEDSIPKYEAYKITDYQEYKTIQNKELLKELIEHTILLIENTTEDLSQFNTLQDGLNFFSIALPSNYFVKVDEVADLRTRLNEGKAKFEREYNTIITFQKEFNCEELKAKYYMTADINNYYRKLLNFRLSYHGGYSKK